MTYDPKHDEHEVAACDGRIAAWCYRLDDFRVAVDSCAECEEWRRLRHPLQSMCDDHCRALRRIHDDRDRNERERYRTLWRLEAYEAGLRAGAAAMRARLMRGGES